MKINNNRENQDLVVFYAITVYNTGEMQKSDIQYSVYQSGKSELKSNMINSDS